MVHLPVYDLLWANHFASNQLIHICYLVAFAKVYDFDWDPTIQRVLINGMIQYDISLQSLERTISVYQTTRAISDLGAKALRE